MGAVYRAEDTKLGRVVALKFLVRHLVQDEESHTRFLREAQAAAALNDPNICTIHEIDELDGESFIVMEHIAGQSLKDKIAARPLKLDEALDVAIQTAQALQAAHEKGIVHRDIKSANIMLTERGQVKVMDFGLAQVGDRTHLTKSGTTLGTPSYMSPEQVKAQPTDRRTDIWSLGVVLYEMLTGQLPFKGEVEVAVTYGVVNTDPELPTALRSRLPVEIDRVIDRALAKDPEERYQHIEGMIVDLQAIQRGELKTVSRRIHKGRRRRFMLVGAASAAVAALVAAFGFDWLSGLRFGTSSEPGASVVVLPLDNISGDADQEYFSDGMTDALISDLGKIRALKVISRVSSMRFKGSRKPLPEIVQELGVSHVVTGSVMQAGGQVRITAQLVEGKTDKQLWSDSFVRERRNILTLQAVVASTIARQIQGELTPLEESLLAGGDEVNPDAYDAYLKGQYHSWRLTPSDLDEAQRYYELAIETDGDFAPAHAGAGLVWGYRSQAALVPPQVARPRNAAALEKALQLDSSDEEVLHAQAVYETWANWDWEQAETAFRKVLEINPNHLNSHAFLAHLLMILGRFDEANQHSERAIALDQYNPLPRVLYAIVLNGAGRFDEALEQLDEARRLGASNFVLHYGLQNAYWGKRLKQRALIEEREWFEALGASGVAAALDRGYEAGGYEQAMRSAAQALAARAETTYVEPRTIAHIFMKGGDKGRALDWLEEGVKIRDMNMPYNASTPIFMDLHDEPRFRELQRKMNLPMLSE